MLRTRLRHSRPTWNIAVHVVDRERNRRSVVVICAGFLARSSHYRSFADDLSLTIRVGRSGPLAKLVS